MEELQTEQNSLSLSNVDLEEVFSLGLEMNHIWLLSKLGEGYWTSIPKVQVWFQTLQRKGYIVLNPSNFYVATEEGKTLLNAISKGEKGLKQTQRKKIVKKQEEKNSDFDRWWNAYPRVEAFSYGGKEFAGSRAFRNSIDECKAKFLKILGEKEYTADDLIRALEYEVLQKKRMSVQENTNKLKYMQNSLTYLNNRTYENWMEQSKKAIVEIKEPIKSFSI